jgi:hypothetical protein
VRERRSAGDRVKRRSVLFVLLATVYVGSCMFRITRFVAGGAPVDLAIAFGWLVLVIALLERCRERS